MQSYRLRHRVAIQEQIETQEDDGSITHQWQTITVGSTQMQSVPAEVLTGAGKEAVNSATTMASVDARINIRWFPGLNEKMRVVWQGKPYNIVGLTTDITGREEWRMQCAAGLSDGR